MKISFRDLLRLIDKVDRLPNGCAVWKDSACVNSGKQPVITIQQKTLAVRTVLRRLLSVCKSDHRACATPLCIHRDHDRVRQLTAASA